jgi:hypothetical protein
MDSRLTRHPLLALLICGVLFVLGPVACADLQVTPAPLTKSDTADRYRLDQTVKGESSAGYTTTLASGSEWIIIGSIAEGDVYRPLSTSIAARAYDDSEAYLVVRVGNWVGFWLPVEEAYTPLKRPVPIPLSPGPSR